MKKEFKEENISEYDNLYYYCNSTDGMQYLWCDGTFHYCATDDDVVEKHYDEEDLDNPNRHYKGWFSSKEAIREVFLLYNNPKIKIKEEVLYNIKDSYELVVCFINRDTLTLKDLSENELLVLIDFYNGLENKSMNVYEITSHLKHHNLQDNYEYDEVWCINGFTFEPSKYSHYELFSYKNGRKYKAEII